MFEHLKWVFGPETFSLGPYFGHAGLDPRLDPPTFETCVLQDNDLHPYWRCFCSTVSAVWATPVPPHGAASPAEFPLCDKWQWSSGNMPTGGLSVILAGQRGSSVSLNHRAFYHRLLTSLEAMQKETCHWTRTTHFLTLPICFFHEQYDQRELLFGSSSQRENVLCHLNRWSFTFGQKRCSGFWFWWIDLTNVSSAAELQLRWGETRGPYITPRELLLSFSRCYRKHVTVGIIYCHICIPLGVTEMPPFAVHVLKCCVGVPSSKWCWCWKCR